jgi:thiamine-phosphate pyrophosphorylase
VTQQEAAFPSISPIGERRQARLADARLGAVVDARRSRDELTRHLTALGEASIDVLRLGDDTATEDELRAAADVFRRVCDRVGALFLVDRLPGLAVQVGADGVHLGSVDLHPDVARSVVGPDLLIGRAARSAEAIDASGDEDVDLLVVGEDRPAGDRDELVAHAARWASHPWFASVGDVAEAGALVELGARRVVAVAGSLPPDDPGAACWALRRPVAVAPLA